MKRRDFITGLSAPIILSGLPARAATSLDELSAYLNTIKTLRTRFRQYVGNGGRADGTLMIARPRRMRFEYDPPNRALVVASAGRVAIFDGRSNSGPKIYPTNRTPLGLILGREVDLANSPMIYGHGQDGKYTFIDVRDPKRPELGSMRMLFTSNPIKLERWVVTEANGQRVTIVLGDFELGMRLSNRLFDIDALTAN